MKKSFLQQGGLIIAAVLLLPLAVYAAEAGGTAPATQQPAVSTDLSKAIPAETSESWFKWGGDFRFREKFIKNQFTFNDSAVGNEWHYERYRTRLWGTVEADQDVSINARLTWEFRTWDEPPLKPQHTDFDEIIFDRLNVTLKNAFGEPATLVAGRQDIIFADGWLVLDGTPLDGSRTIFFDAVRYTYDLKADNMTLDMIYIDQASAADRWLKPINDRENALIEQDERGAILYLTNKNVPDTQWDHYFIYKNDDKVTSTGNNSDLYTLGSRIAKDVDENWKYRLEGAVQTGNKNSNDVMAFGVNSRASYFVNDTLNNNYRIGYEFLSGDHPGSSKNEAFDPLWGRWPQWSELYIYSYASETRIAETTNLHRVNVGWSFNPCSKIEMCTDYHLLFSDQNTDRGTSIFSESGSFRGQLLTALLKYKANKNLSAHLLGEFFFPGNYYKNANNDPATFLRAEVMFTF